LLFTLSELIKLISANIKRRVKDPRYEALAASDQVDVRIGGRNLSYRVVTEPLSLFTGDEESLPEYAILLGPVEAIQLTISRDISAKLWIFAGDANFPGSVWEGEADLQQAFFLGRVDFTGSSFAKAVDFGSCRFYDDARFEETEFHDDARFTSAKFYREAGFGLGFFSAGAYFKDVAFTGATDFSNAHMDGSTHFSAAVFSESTMFTGVRFADSVNFNGINALSDMNFSQCEFNKDVSFSWYKFGEEVLFSGSRFSSLVIFNDGFFSGKCSFGDVSFDDAVTISGSDFREHLDFSGAVFNENAYLVNNSFRKNVYFGGVTFDGGGRVFIDASLFEADSFFTGSYINKEVLFMKSEFGRRTDLTQLILGENGRLNLIECVFNSIVDFSDPEELKGTIFIDKTDFIRKCLLLFQVIRGDNGKFDALIIPKENGDGIDAEMTARNFSSFREIYQRNNELDNELELLYQSRIYERRHRFGWDEQAKWPVNIANRMAAGLSWLFLDRTSRYFTSWGSVLKTIMITILSFAVLYSLAPLFGELGLAIGTVDGISSEIGSVSDFLAYAGENLYFSLITFTTIGYGDLLPTGFLRILAGFEGFLGITLTSVFLVSLAKRVLG
jgi:hypothetical protein